MAESEGQAEAGYPESGGEGEGVGGEQAGPRATSVKSPAEWSRSGWGEAAESKFRLRGPDYDTALPGQQHVPFGLQPAKRLAPRGK